LLAYVASSVALVTDSCDAPADARKMATLNVAVVCRDPDLRLQAARAFDAAPGSWSVRLHQHPPPGADVVVYGADVDPEASIVFDPRDPERMLAEIARCAGRGRVIAVTGAGRGLGVTSVALHLSALLARRWRTCCVDLDARWGAGDRLGLGSDARRARAADGSLDPVMLSALPVRGGFRVVLGAGDLEEEDRRDLVERARGEFEIVILDAPCDTDLEFAVELCDAAVMVMSPGVTGARRAASLSASFPDVSWVLVTNRLGPGGETTRAGLQRIAGTDIRVELPCSPTLRDREDEGELLASGWTRWNRRLESLASALVPK
jgi:Mrp family chromosome partitioning ATPase